MSELGLSAARAPFEELGYAIFPSRLADDILQALEAEFQRLTDRWSTPREGMRVVHAVRGVLSKSRVAREVSELLRRYADHLLGAASAVTQGTFFDKTTASNWLVPWHQDLTITLDQKSDIPGFSHWRQKEGVWHVQPPLDLLENTVALRIHLDRCDATNGALRVLPRSHRRGILEEVSSLMKNSEDEPVTLTAERGDLIAMAPLLLHSSQKMQRESQRRVLHLEYCCGQLPAPLSWYHS